MRKLPIAVGVCAFVFFASVSTAQASHQIEHVRAQARKSSQVIQFFEGEGRWLRAPRVEKCSEVPWRKSCRAAREAYAMHKQLLYVAQKRLQAARTPVGEAAIRRYIQDDCLEEIIDRETAGTWSPTVFNYQGSGAYGLPQALPGYKMASAGADWRTNPVTQIRWMRRYVNSRYGGSCNALAHHNARGWY